MGSLLSFQLLEAMKLFMGLLCLNCGMRCMQQGLDYAFMAALAEARSDPKSLDGSIAAACNGSALPVSCQTVLVGFLMIAYAPLLRRLKAAVGKQQPN